MFYLLPQDPQSDINYNFISNEWFTGEICQSALFLQSTDY